MALLRCEECGGQVSDRAPGCPHCGCPPKSARQASDTGSSTDLVGETATIESPVRPRSPIDALHPPPPQPTGRHVFLSYQSEDREKARRLADALERRGWPVWWDRDIQAGQAFRTVIQRALDGAACGVVLWTSKSIESEWVQEEAQVAKARGILIPVLIESVRQPLGFGQVQAADLTDWDGQPDDPRLAELLSGVAALMGSNGVPPLLDDDEWAVVIQSGRRSRGLARDARAEEERSAAEAAEGAAAQAEAERMAAARAGRPEQEADAARRSAELEEAARIAREAAEEREARLAVELAEEHAAELRTIAARRIAREAETRAAEAAAQAAKEAAERTATLQAAAAADKKAAEEVAAGRAPEIEERARMIAGEAARAESSWFRFPKEGVATLLGGLMVVMAVFLPWVESGDTAMNLAPGATAMEIPVDFLFEYAVEQGNTLGVVLLVVGGLGAVLALFRIPRWITVILGLIVVVCAIMFFVQVLRSLIDVELADDFFEVIRIGPAIALLGGLLMSSGR